ncbi:ribosome-associated ATPase/putative transporter RbbA [Methylocystis sp. SC2]|uniref:ribosome-associated ATPase/putative transporter RbbA n=1 Tax=Methylocystis sp. (strain SC2) TaxID=187303 RepID=UPI00027AE86F|nr:ribosome-associated ATPase/putative transporter RbbA [Methylocystis sp. SC2]CCJ07329.1 ABC transporter, ATP binding/permease protein [Methylocystis sp. SC2]
MTDTAAEIRAVTHRYGKLFALDNVTLIVPGGCMAGLIGPDGVGKSTLLALISGVRRMQEGEIHALGGDMRAPSHRAASYARIAYMPQGLGRNLYPTLSVHENLDFFGRLFGQSKEERVRRIAELLAATGLAPFPDRPAGNLSGGMKQKLSLCCALIHDPDLLILDEPTTGVDPLSRRQFWELIDRLRARRPNMSVIVATAYMEEAERFDWLAAMDDGKILTRGAPGQIMASARKDTLDAAFIALLPPEKRAAHKTVTVPPLQTANREFSIEADNLTKAFGDFIAVDRVSFRIARGEIFGFLGSNGCGKSTTMKMLTGLLPATAGSARLFGKKLDAGDMETRRRVGYMSQSFSLYGELTVRQNLELHARLFSLPKERGAERVAEMLKRFELVEVADSAPEDLSLGMRQRLQLAVAIIHEPEVLILDEPTSGVDPVARDSFWLSLIELSRNDGVTIFISTHFMNEAERCDRISLMHAGKVLAIGAPARLVAEKGKTALEDAFVAYLEDAGGEAAVAPLTDALASSSNTREAHRARFFGFDLGRLWANTYRESLEILRDPLRLAFALFSPLILMITFGYGISFDVENLPYAVLDQDRTLESREFLESFSGSRYFVQESDINSTAELERRLVSGEIKLAVEIPPNFGRDLINGKTPEVAVWIDGAMPFRAETIRGYVEGITHKYLADQSTRHDGAAPPPALVNMETRFRYNQSFKSVYAIIPGVIMLMLALVPAMMTAVSVVREKETGSIANFRSTPVRRLEFLLGKQLPYVAISLLSFGMLVLSAITIFGVPVRGSAATLAIGTFLYVFATTGFGLLVSSFIRTQVAAIFITAVISIIPAVNFSGLLVPVSSLSGSGRVLGLTFPAAWYHQISIGTFTKGLGFTLLWPDLIALGVFTLVFLAAATVGLHKQES